MIICPEQSEQATPASTSLAGILTVLHMIFKGIY